MGWFTRELNFVKYAQAVADWNSVAYGSHDKPLDDQWALVEEEGKEVLEAFGAKDKAEFLKEMLDMFVVISYYRFLAYKEVSYDRETMGLYHNLQLFSVKDLVEFLVNSIKVGDSIDALTATFAILSKLDADVEGAIKEVLRSNNSKFAPYQAREEDSYDQQCKELEGERYKNVTWSLNGDKVVFKAGSGKVLKSPSTYSPANVGKFINREEK